MALGPAVVLTILALAGQGPGDSTARRLTAIADDYLAGWLAAFPETATIFGIPGARHDRLRDRSAAAERRWEAREDRWLAQLRRIDPADLLGRPEWVTYGLLREELEASTRLRVCRNRLWTVHPLTGWQASLAALAQQQPVGTAELRAQALTRWRGLPRVVVAEIANLREGVRLGYTEPAVNVRRVLAGTDKLLAGPPTESPFFSPAARDSTPAFRAAFAQLIATEIAPALRRYRDYLARHYLPVAREAVSVTANPHGVECYRAAIRRYTTLDLSGEEIYDLGTREIAAAESTMAVLSRRAYGTADYRSVMERLHGDSAYTFRSRDAVVPAIDTILARAWAAVPRWFDMRPTSRVAVQPFPEFQELSVPLGQYLRAALDGSRPGVYRVNLYLATKPGGRLEMDRLTFHEAVPGHHFQVAIAQERRGVHPLTRYLSNSAFTEGWGIYAERLADEMGLYGSDAERLNDLEAMVYLYATLVMETGMHVKGWTRQQAIDYETSHTSRSAEQAALDVDRRIGWPGQGLSYAIGYVEIRRLRTLAQSRLGDRFDVKEFHDRVLEDGILTLPMLREKVERWARGAS
jgi:uncharacterized protein (DUF885 family)